jgi:CHAD domain-containing protein
VKNFMPLKRKESLREGLQRISERRLQDVLQMIAHEGPTAESVHEARKIVKSLRATLRLTRGALSTEARKARNQVLRDFAGRFSGPRDAAVTLSTFEKVYPLSLNGKHHPKARPPWAAELQQSLLARAHAPLPAESYRDAVQQVRCLSGQLLPFEDGGHQERPSRPAGEDDWDNTVAEGLQKTYRQGRRLLRQVAAASESPDELWHELRKRVKDLGYQLALHKKIKGVKPQLAKLDEVGGALGDARDLSLLRNYLGKVQEKSELSPVECESYRRLLTRLNGWRRRLHRRALDVGRRVYGRGSKRFTQRMAKHWRQWKSD